MIEVRGLSKRFGRFEALREVSFSVAEGSAFALIGANGAGKTTCIKILMNILEPTQGSATVLGADSRGISPRELNQIGYVSENQEMPARLTVAEFFDYLRPFYSRWDRGLESDIRSQLRLDSRDDFQLLKEGRSDGEGRIHPEIRMRPEQYDQLKNQPVRLEIEYSLTLFRMSTANTLGALGGDQQVPETGRCTTTMDDEQDDVIFRCIIPGKHTGCDTMFLENPSSGQRNPEKFFCRADYAPYPLSIDPDVMGGGGASLPFRDLTGLAHYPVDGNQLTQSQIVVRTYHPVEHFTRRLVIPQIKLGDWEPR